MVVRQLGLHHVAYFRAAFESSLALTDVAARYLGPDVGLPAAKRTLHAVQAALVQAAQRRGKYGAAALLRLPRGRLSAQPTPASAATPIVRPAHPSLEEFREEVDSDGFYSDAELIDLYEEEYGAPQTEEIDTPPDNRRLLRNARLLQKKLQLINALASEIAQPPKEEDRVEGWFAPALASQLAAVGLATLGDLIRFMNYRGYRWYDLVPRLGQKRAAEIVAFLQSSALISALDAYATVPARTYRAQRRSQGGPAAPSGAIVPLEKFSSPAALDGSGGTNRMPEVRNKLDVRNDLEAIHAWLRLYTSKPHTERAYRKEAERLLLWSIYAQHKPFSSLTTQDVAEYVQFLAQPEPAGIWVAQRRYERFHSAWRPFVKKGLGARSLGYATQVLSVMCAWLVGQRYLDSNPFEGLPRLNRGAIKPTKRSLSFQQWAQVREYLNAQPRSLASVRLTFLMLLVYATGLRRSEVAKARLGDLKVRHFAEKSAWFLAVVGKGGRAREVPFVRPVMKALDAYLQARGHHVENVLDLPPETPLIASLEDSTHSLTDNAIYGLFKACFSAVGEWVSRQDKEAALVFKKASTHWLRHTHATHALRRGVGLENVRDNLGHSSIAVSSLYIDTALEEQHSQTEAFIEEACDSLKC